jgi:iron-sulfur cluster assembly protein
MVNKNKMEDIKLESPVKNGISLTDSAIKEIKRSMVAENVSPEKGLRIGVKGGGCAGFTYTMSFDAPQDGDSVYEVEGVKILVDLMSELYLKGTELDFGTGLNARGFIYNNPNATKTCGCGESFG